VRQPSLVILAIQGYGYEIQRAELTFVAMADSAFAIVAPLASPIQPVVTSNSMRVTAAHLVGAGGV